MDSLASWLNANGPAVQASAALVTALATAGLLVVTGWYAKTSDKLVKGQHLAELIRHEPLVVIASTIVERSNGEPERVRLSVRNIGHGPAYHVFVAALVGGEELLMKWADSAPGHESTLEGNEERLVVLGARDLKVVLASPGTEVVIRTSCFNVFGKRKLQDFSHVVTIDGTLHMTTQAGLLQNLVDG